ncbi:hypothetical protein LRP88_09454 [Fusarium phalaenopsidis]
MSATTTQTGAQAQALPSLQANAAQSYGDWRDDFFKNGYYVFKDWLQSFDNGFDLGDKATWTKEHLLQNFRHMYLNYYAAHEKFMWDARTEPEIVKRFKELWGTKELLVSFDTFNITLPGRKDIDFAPRPHTDQAPERKGLACVQGLLNLSPAGPKDGGLLLMVGSSSLFEEFFRCSPARDGGNVAAKFYDFYDFNEDEIKWFEEKGCRQIKVNAEPGDLILWDSRTIHHVALPESETIRTVLYTCFTPAALAKPEDVTYKAELFGR